MQAGSGVSAYLLHRYPYRDSSLVLEWFSREHGRVAAVARGARRASSTFGRLQPWQRYQIAWRGRGDLVTLVQGEESGPLLHMPPLASLCGFYLNELLLRLLTRWDPHPDLFDDYQAVLAALPDQSRPDWLLRRFEWRLLRAMGFAPELSQCKVCHTTLESGVATWFYAPMDGVFCQDHGAGLPGVVPVYALTLRQLLRDGDCPDAAQRLVLQKCLAQDLAAHLGGKPLQSRVLLREYWRRREAVADA